jgi:predicted site-specific integrase-resolvase
VIAGSRPNPNGKWLFDVHSIGIVPQVQPSDRGGGTLNGVQAIYARVSTRKQLDDLKSQIGTLTTKYPDHIVFSDCASGLNFKRKGLLSLLQLAFEGRLRLVRIAHRDRLCRFAFDLLEHVFLKHGVKIHVEASDLPSSAQSELAEDVLAVITVFGARLHGARSAGRRRKPATLQGKEKGQRRGEGSAANAVGEEAYSCVPHTSSTHGTAAQAGDPGHSSAAGSLQLCSGVGQ